MTKKHQWPLGNHQGTTRGHQGTTRDHLGPLGNHQGPLGTTRGHQGPLGNHSGPLGNHQRASQSEQKVPQVDHLIQYLYFYILYARYVECHSTFFCAQLEHKLRMQRLRRPLKRTAAGEGDTSLCVRAASQIVKFIMIGHSSSSCGGCEWQDKFRPCCKKLVLPPPWNHGFILSFALLMFDWRSGWLSGWLAGWLTGLMQPQTTCSTQ